MAIEYRKKHSYRDIGVTVKTVTRPIMPPVKTDFEEGILYYDGSINFSDAGGRLFYEDKILELEFIVEANDKKELSRKLSKFINWMSGGYGDLIFDDMPMIVWHAMPVHISEAILELERLGKTTVQFRCTPFNSYVFQCDYDILLGDSYITLGADIPIGGFVPPTFNIATGTNDITVHYTGSAPVKPTIAFNGTFKNITITDGVKTLTVTGTVTDLNIDCKRCICTDETGDVTKHSSGEFIELSQDYTTITITCTGAGSVKVIYTAQYYFGEE